MEVLMMFCAILQLAFLLLKALEIISWSWIWVTSPFWGFLLVVTICVIIEKNKKY